MSIRDVIRDCVSGQELFQLKPLLPGVVIARDVFCHPRVFRFVTNQSSDVPRALTPRAADARAALDQFCAGAIVSVGMDPDKKPAYTELARNHETAKGIWDFRIRDPKPQVRIFGAFAEKDVFVALDYRNRDGLDFDAAVATSAQLWTDLFDNLTPVTGDQIGAYLTDRYRLV